jgi:hypothetical protein
MNNLIIYGFGSTGKYIVNYLLKNLSDIIYKYSKKVFWMIKPIKIDL